MTHTQHTTWARRLRSLLLALIVGVIVGVIWIATHGEQLRINR